MNCLNHPETTAVAYCRTCGKALCEVCRRAADGVIYCQEHAPASEPVRGAAPASAVQTVRPGISPGLAFVLGLIPGVGAIYNGQYAKGLVHAVIFGMLVSIAESGGDSAGALLGILITAWVFYMAFEAHHTARRRMLGEPVDEFSSLIEFNPRSRSFPVGAVVLIVLGVLFLLNTLDILRLGQVLRFWPVALIAVGAYMLYIRIVGDSAPSGDVQEVRHGRQ